MVGEAILAAETVVGRVGEGAIGVEGQGAVAGIAFKDGGQTVAIIVAVIAQHPWRVNNERRVA